MYKVGDEEDTAGLELVVKTETSIELLGFIKTLASLAIKHGLFIRFLKASDIVDGVVALFLVVKDTAHLSDFIRDVSGLNEVIEIKEAEKIEDIIYPEKLYPLQSFGQRWLLLGPANLSGFVINTRKILGEAVADLLLFKLGEAVGHEVYRIYNRTMGGFGTLTKLLGFIRFIMKIAGWGILESYEIENKEILLVLRDYWESNLLVKHSLKAEPAYMKGILKGLFSKALKKDVVVRLLFMKPEDNDTITVFKILR